MRKILLTVVCLLTLNAALDVEISVPGVAVYEDVVFAQYFTWPEATLKMDIFVPGDGQEKHPAVMFIIGGAWLASPKNAGAQICMKLAENGFIAASIEYRLIGAANYEEIIADTRAAVSFLREHADEFAIDKDRIAVMGMSAGGTLAAMLGLTDGELRGVVDCFGLTDLSTVADDYSDERKALYYSPSSFVSLFANGVALYKGRKGESILDNPETAKAASPLTYVSKNSPPFLIFHGDSDKTVSPSQSKRLHDALIENGVDSTLYIIKGGEHDGKYFYQPEVMKIIVDFLNRVLK